MKDANYIHEQILQKKSMLCVGLDPDVNLMPESYKLSENPLFYFCKDIIESTYEFQ